MRIVLPIALFLLFGMGASSGEPDPDHKAFQGTWNLVESTRSGRKEEVKGRITITFKGDQWKVQLGTESGGKSGTFKVDSTKKPKAFEMVDGGDRYIGIYTLDGNRLKICTVSPKKDKENKRPLPERPTTFESTKENQADLMVLERMK